MIQEQKPAFSHPPLVTWRKGEGDREVTMCTPSPCQVLCPQTQDFWYYQFGIFGFISFLSSFRILGPSFTQLSLQLKKKWIWEVESQPSHWLPEWWLWWSVPESQSRGWFLPLESVPKTSGERKSRHWPKTSKCGHHPYARHLSPRSHSLPSPFSCTIDALTGSPQVTTHCSLVFPLATAYRLTHYFLLLWMSCFYHLYVLLLLFFPILTLLSHLGPGANIFAYSELRFQFLILCMNACPRISYFSIWAPSNQ